LVKRCAALLTVLLAGVCALRGAAPRAIPEPKVVDGYLKLDFFWLSSYDFVRPAPDAPPGPGGKPDNGEAQIPPAIKKWDGARVILTGFMLPTSFSEGKTTEFLLMANLMLCCYATVPKVNDWVLVRLPGGTDVIQDQPITFRGRFHVGARVDDGILTAVYEMDAEGPGKVEE
jgi:hypothetical protein